MPANHGPSLPVSLLRMRYARMNRFGSSLPALTTRSRGPMVLVRVVAVAVVVWQLALLMWDEDEVSVAPNPVPRVVVLGPDREE